ncbi:hypothetical protein AVEN_59539-1 [Araneus ventricosus]|uniref:Uncharacterized protein n=1 Tax=Araneus ventricosus TaxID=182803 RepID=A0A4Y2R959_ARAVE|nr:hypothetical protein AVEN_59539-1 [Araneus ventricosus]
MGATPPSPNLRAARVLEHLTRDIDAQHAHIHFRPSLESGFETQILRTRDLTLVLASLSPSLGTTPVLEHLTCDVRLDVKYTHVHFGPLVESGFEPGTIWLRG